MELDLYPSDKTGTDTLDMKQLSAAAAATDYIVKT